MKSTISRRCLVPGATSRVAAHYLAAIIAGGSGVGAVPAIPQDPSYHRFADQRQWLGVPNAADVLSNLAFALVGLLGCDSPCLASASTLLAGDGSRPVVRCARPRRHGDGLDVVSPRSEQCVLVWDRLPMTLVFAGVLGTAIAQRAGNDVGRLSLALLVPLGIASVAYWKVTGDLSLYAALQLGGIVGLLLLMLLTRKGNDSIPWAWVLGWYALAKVAEFADRAIFDATHQLIAGHTLKHLLAAAAGAAALWPLRARR